MSELNKIISFITAIKLQAGIDSDEKKKVLFDEYKNFLSATQRHDCASVWRNYRAACRVAAGLDLPQVKPRSEHLIIERQLELF